MTIYSKCFSALTFKLHLKSLFFSFPLTNFFEIVPPHRLKKSMAGSVRFACDLSQYSGGAQGQECASRRQKFVRRVAK